MRARHLAAVVAAASTLSALPPQAQSAPNDVPPLLPQPPNQNACQPDIKAAPRSNETTGSPSLSDQLAASKGVICPPAGVDPGIAAPPVGGGRTPVIPPPGTPGGDPGIQPR
jgi:hypothetical protein